MELPCNVYIKPHLNLLTTDLTKALLSNQFSQPTRKKKAPSENSKARRGCFAKLSAKNYGGGNERGDQQSL